MQADALVPKLVLSDAPLDGTSVSSWLRSVWPAIPFQLRQQLVIALFHMKLGDMVRIGASRDGSAARMPRHGAVGLTLPEGVLPAKTGTSS